MPPGHGSGAGGVAPCDLVRLCCAWDAHVKLIVASHATNPLTPPVRPAYRRSMKTLRQWIEETGDAEAGRVLGVSRAQACRLRTGANRPSLEVLRRAQTAWGDGLDIGGTIAESGPPDAAPAADPPEAA